MDSKLLAQFVRFLFGCFMGMVAVVVGLFIALLFAACAGSKNLSSDTLSVASSDATTELSRESSVAQPVDLTPAQVAQLPRSQQRQYRKNLRAQPRTVPLIQGRAAVAGNITAPVQTSYKPDAAVVLATDSAKVQVAQTKKGPAVAGEGNTVPITTTEESWLRPLLPYAVGVLGLALLYSLLPLGLAGSGWLWVLLRKGRSPEPETG